MEIEEKIKNKINELIATGSQLGKSGDFGLDRNQDHTQQCIAWLTSAQNIVYKVISDPKNPFRTSLDKICKFHENSTASPKVGAISKILISLLKDIESGLIASLENQTRAIVFDDFLDHAKEYAKHNSPKEAGVISGVVFEDSLRTICRNQNIKEKGKKLDSLIDQLVKEGIITQIKAKRAKVAAHVRTKATHAQWDEFDLNDVRTTIKFTEELILDYLEK